MAHRIDTSTALKDKFGVGKNGFTRGNPQTGVPATELDDDYFDMLQEEIVGIVEAAGDTLDKTQRNQLNAALGKLFQNKTGATAALGALVPAANRLPYFTGANGASLTDLTPVGRDILAAATKAAVLEYLGLGDVVRETRTINGQSLDKDITIPASATGALAINNNLSDLQSISTALSHLGLSDVIHGSKFQLPIAWCRFNGFTGAINSQVGISSITRHGPGQYSVGLANPMASVSYAVVGSAGNGPGEVTRIARVFTASPRQQSAFSITIFDNNTDTIADADAVDFLIMGELA